MQNPSAPTIFLASSSPYRRGLLDRFLDNYETVTPGVDESNEAGLPAAELATYLARKKAEAIAVNARQALIIGADQLAVLDDQVLGKPGESSESRRATAGGVGQNGDISHRRLHSRPDRPSTV